MTHLLEHHDEAVVEGLSEDGGQQAQVEEDVERDLHDCAIARLFFQRRGVDYQKVCDSKWCCLCDNRQRDPAEMWS